jgi:outer membrane receptor protein involved in Fe transport
VDRINGFLHAEYDITDNWTLFGEGTLSRSHTPFEQYYNYNAGSNALTIYSGNPYIPAAIQSQMTAQGIASFTLGKYWSNLPENVADNYSTTQRFVGGLNGKLGGDWTAKAYFTHGQSQLKVFDRNILNNRNIYAATDAVVNPANGQIVCRSTLNGLDPGCTPINPFGTGAINAATAAYVTGDSWRYLKLTQDVAAVNVQGSLPDWAALWSKPASLAVGAEWRRETANQTSDAVSQAINNFAGLRGAASSQSGTLGGFYASNPQPISGRVTVKELYGELALPVAADRPFIKALDLNAAVRLTDYSTSGQVVTWKLGGVWKPVQDLTLRLTRSRDIRAPNILELFSGGVAGNATVIDPKTGATVPFLGYTRGNPDLKPEKANTLTFGMVCSQPSCAGSICRWTITTSRSARRLPRFRRRIRSTNARRAPRWSARKSSSPTAPITSTCCPSIWPRRATAGSISRRVTALGCWAGG